MTFILVSIIAFWTLSASFAVILCGAAKGGDRPEQPEFVNVSVSEALASLATRP